MSEIKPALDPEDWSDLLKVLPIPEDKNAITWLEVEYSTWAGAQQAGALCLHGQPFGFTWADVDLLRETAEWAEGEARPYPAGCAEARAPYDALADRIAALLPPREAK